MPMRRLQHRAEQGVSHADGRVFNRNNIPVRDIAKSLIEVEPVVISEFSLEHHVAVNAISEARSQAQVIRVGLRDVEGIEEDSSFHPGLCESGG